jgi:anti-anti-sigma factor
MFADLAGVSLWDCSEGSEVVAQGELDLAALPWLRSALKVACWDRTGDVIVNFENVTFCDSHAIGLLRATSARLRAHGRRLIIRGNPPRQSRVFRVHGLEHLLAPA